MESIFKNLAFKDTLDFIIRDKILSTLSLEKFTIQDYLKYSNINMYFF